MTDSFIQVFPEMHAELYYCVPTHLCITGAEPDHAADIYEEIFKEANVSCKAVHDIEPIVERITYKSIALELLGDIALGAS